MPEGRRQLDAYFDFFFFPAFFFIVLFSFDLDLVALVPGFFLIGIGTSLDGRCCRTSAQTWLALNAFGRDYRNTLCLDQDIRVIFIKKF